MHEVGLVEEAIEMARTVARTSQASKIERLTFAISAGGHVTPEAVQTVFESLSLGTEAEGAELAFETQQAQSLCLNCARTISSGTSDSCPACGSKAVRRLPTPELSLKYVDLPEED
jgi:hydrogenase nickel incorporation protein HypA/HybF